jgi:hypothetical protein
MNTKKTLVFAIALAALAAFFFLYEQPRHTDKEKAELEGEKILDLKWDAVAKIELARGEEKLVFAKDAASGEWRMTEPVDDQTERWMVQSLVSAVQYARPSRTIKDPDADSLKRFGLDAPRTVVGYEADGATKRVRFGARNPVGNTVYVKPEDRNVVYLLVESTVSALDKPAVEFRRKDLLSPADATLKLSRLDIEAAGEPPLTLVSVAPPKQETEEGGFDTREPVWHLDNADGPVADEEAMRGLVDKVTSCKAVEFATGVGDDPAALGLDQPELRITATYGEGDKQTSVALAIGKKKEPGATYFAQTPGRPFVVEVHQDTVQALRITRNDLRDRRLLAAIDPARVAIIDLQSPTASFRISRSSAGWAFADESAADGLKIDDWLKKAARWRAEELAEGPASRRLAVMARRRDATVVTLSNAEAQVLAVLRFSAPYEPAPPKPAKAAAETPPPEPEFAPADKERVAVTVDGGYPGVTYVVKAGVRGDLPKWADEWKAPPAETPDAAPADQGPAATPEDDG